MGFHILMSYNFPWLGPQIKGELINHDSLYSGTSKHDRHLKHTITLISLSDNDILSGNGELLLTKYRPIIVVGLMVL